MGAMADADALPVRCLQWKDTCQNLTEDAHERYTFLLGFTPKKETEVFDRIYRSEEGWEKWFQRV